MTDINKPKTLRETVSCLHEGFIAYKENEYKPMKEIIKRLDVAMFSENSDNEFGMPGLMTLHKRFLNYIEISYKFWRVVIVGGVFALITFLGVIFAIFKNVGWI